ncbi:uncharacterized protein LOC130613676 isoform X3 [Hydractinia symbiolongicarpus]|uniref:uncharacterized protein LOC130613676 isoform X3 n=1 Tax=Hydractinia symbiolongicarpus TaxID=13093 RepID=UPI00254FB75E|nr:uncharacterized protein LOC130613676 isoform X3 [Hydractinia symbiolongicarpus]
MFRRAVCYCFLFLISNCKGDDSSKNGRQDISRSENLRCVKYNHVLPSGQCIEFFNNTYVVGTREDIIKKERLFSRIIRQVLPFYSYFLKQGRQNDITGYGKCGKNEEGRKIIQSTYFPSTTELLECGQKNVIKEVMCRHWIPEDASVKKCSTHCYHGNGLFYNGNENITVTSKRCLPWNINPYLNKELYPTLKENHCRNPQGYRLKP